MKKKPEALSSKQTLNIMQYNSSAEAIPCTSSMTFLCSCVNTEVTHCFCSSKIPSQIVRPPCLSGPDETHNPCTPSGKCTHVSRESKQLHLHACGASDTALIRKWLTQSTAVQHMHFTRV